MRLPDKSQGCAIGALNPGSGGGDDLTRLRTEEVQRTFERERDAVLWTAVQMLAKYANDLLPVISQVRDGEGQ
jgi:hypothetical protein